MNAAAGTGDLRRLLWLRTLSILLQALVVLGVRFSLGWRLPLAQIGLLLGALGLWTLVAAVRACGRPEAGTGRLLLELVLDAGALTGVLYYTGGATNPFAWFYLLPVTLGAMLLPARLAWLLTALTVSGYSLLMRHYVPLPYGDMGHGGFGLHVFGMWFGFVLSAALMTFVITRMVVAIRARDRRLAEARERALRQERLVALGTLAAGAAHELGTPLGSLALLCDEVAELADGGEAEALRQRLAAMREQIRRCKGVLSDISASSGALRADAGRVRPVDDYLREILDQWRRRRPEARLRVRLERAGGGAPALVADRTLTQALFNLLDNAAQVSPQAVEFLADWDPEGVVMDVCDRGPGLEPQIRLSLGRRPVTTKAEGLGVGLFLAQATIERMGGSLRLFDREGGGVCARVRLPAVAGTAA